MHPRVVHLKREPFDVRIDRKTVWGNKFVVGKHGTREECIAKHREWFLKQPKLVARAKQELRGKVLGCWCSPKPCHGDTLLEIANEPLTKTDKLLAAFKASDPKPFVPTTIEELRMIRKR